MVRTCFEPRKSIYAYLCVQISHFLPQQMYIFGEGHFPHISVDLPRIRNHRFLLMANQALENIDKVEPQEGSQLLGADKIDQQEESASSSADKVEIDVLVMKAPSTDVMEAGRELNLEKIDLEIDRLLLVQGLVESNLKNIGTLWPAGEVSDKKITDIEKIVLNKYLCDFGNVILGESVQKLIHISNDSDLPVSFKGEKTYLKGTGYFFQPEHQIHLSSGLSNNKIIELNLMLKTDSPKFKPGEIEAAIPLHIKEVSILELKTNVFTSFADFGFFLLTSFSDFGFSYEFLLQAPRTILLLTANVTKPLLDLSMESLDFESVQLGHCKVLC